MEVKIKKSREGGPMCFIEGRASFPDKRYSLPQFQYGEYWNVCVTGQNPSGTVYFFRFSEKTRVERMKVFVLGGEWGSKWKFHWSSEGPTPVPRTRSYVGGTPYPLVEDGVWEAEVSGLSSFREPPTAVFLKKVGNIEEAIEEEIAKEKSRNGGFLLFEFEDLWAQAQEIVGYGLRDGRDAAHYVLLARNETIPDREAMLEIMVQDLRDMPTRHEKSPVVDVVSATRYYPKWWWYITRKKVYRDGTVGGYVEHLRGTECSTKEDVESFLLQLGENPEDFLIGEGPFDQDSDIGFWDRDM